MDGPGGKHVVNERIWSERFEEMLCSHTDCTIILFGTLYDRDSTRHCV